MPCGVRVPDTRPSYPNLSGFNLVSVLYGTVTRDAGLEGWYEGGPLGGWIFSSGAEAIFEPTTPPLTVTGLWPMVPTCAYIHPEVTVDGVVIIPDTVDWAVNPVTVVSGTVESLYAKNYSAYDRGCTLTIFSLFSLKVRKYSGPTISVNSRPARHEHRRYQLRNRHVKNFNWIA